MMNVEYPSGLCHLGFFLKNFKETVSSMNKNATIPE